MIKKNIVKFSIVAVLLLAAIGGYIGWQVLGPVVSAPEGKYFHIKTGSGYDVVREKLLNEGIIRSGFFFDKLSGRAGYVNHVKPGRYEIKEGMSLLNLVRMLKSGRQSAVRLVINKLRTKEDFASKIGKLMEADSTEAISFLNNIDSLAPYQLDTNTVMTTIIPNSYMVWWNGPFRKVFDRLHEQQAMFWEGERTEKAQALGLSPQQVYTLASIVEEESNKNDEKDKIASVYLNRIRKGMRLEADPTVKFAMRDFGLKRILKIHLAYESPYNTYQNKGLPPGPICTPSIPSIDAVLNAPETDYIFFAAKPEFNGYHNFASTYTQHLVYANAYRRALDSLIKSRNQP